ncbi:MAG: hypothetical protein KC561_17115, partial [Myxococcales bacterium]|nr:hypothetical protein [Myxococcales bacterium]
MATHSTNRCAFALGVVLFAAGCQGDPVQTTPTDATNLSYDAHTDGGTFDGATIDSAGSDSVSGDSHTDSASSETSAWMNLPVVHAHEAAAAERGEALFVDGELGRALVPTQGIESLWLVWGTGFMSGEAYWAAFRERYGFHEAPFDNDGYPLGIHRVSSTMATFDCLMCHSDTVAGEVVIGAGNSVLEWQRLHDDLLTLNGMAGQAGMPTMDPPWELEGVTGAPGANDAMGASFAFSTMITGSSGIPGRGDVNTRMGFQQPPAWWQLRYKNFIYSDGVAQAGNLSTMQAMMLAFGELPNQVEGMDDTFEDIYQFALSTEPPRWPFEPPSEDAIERGREVFDMSCAGCHGTHTGPNAEYPDALITTEDVGTDPTREDALRELEADWANYGLPEDAQMTDTNGYLAPPLVGVWASAPYFHNGSVPTLAGVLDSLSRPARW